MTWTRAQRATEAHLLDHGAAAKLAGAADGDQAAADTNLDNRNREIAAAAARTLRDQAADMQNIAAALRDGIHPTELGYSGAA
jgi:hypothetical protein